MFAATKTRNMKLKPLRGTIEAEAAEERKLKATKKAARHMGFDDSVVER